MAIRWQTATGVWLENEATRHFMPAASHHEQEAPMPWVDIPLSDVRAAELAQWLGASLPDQCSCAPIFPPGFAFCPHCGAALTKAKPKEGELFTPWLGPFADQTLPEHVPKGCFITHHSLANHLPSQNRSSASLPVPPASPCLFFSGDFGFAAPRLFALAYRQGILQYWNPHASDWQLFAREGLPVELAFTGSDYSCLRSLSTKAGAVALIPTRDGLMDLHIDPWRLTYQLSPILARTLVSAPGRVFQHIACLYQASGSHTSSSQTLGRLLLWSRDLASQEEQHEILDMPADMISGWSRPIAYQGKLLWLHAHGQVLWQPGSAPKWLPWPDDWQPCASGWGVSYAPMQSRDGRLWLLGQQRQAYVFLELANSVPHFEACDGVRLGFANFMFRLGHPLHGEPWQGFSVENENDHNALVWPLMACYDSDKRLQGTLAVRLPGYVGTVEQLVNQRASLDSKLEWIGERHLELERLPLARPWEVSCFIHQQHLWMQHPDWAHMRGWPLERVSC